MRNVAPFPPPSIAATVDVDRDVVLPALEPVLSSVSLPEAAQQAEHLIGQVVEVRSLCFNGYVRSDSHPRCSVSGRDTCDAKSIDKKHPKNRSQKSV